MKAWNPRWALIVGLLVIVLSNAVALGGVWWNRRAPAESAIVLSERELGLPWFGVRGEENSGLALNLNWRVADRRQGEYNAAFPVRGGPADWLDSARMAALGFDPAVAGHAAGRQVRQQPRAAIFVLEFDGPAYRQALLTARENAVRHRAAADANAGSKEFGERAKRALEAQGREENWNSRLFVIDAGLDPDALRAKYPDRTRYLLLRGIVRPRLVTRAGQPPALGGYVSQLDASRVQVPHALRQKFESLPAAGRAENQRSRYLVRLMVGQRLEPWLDAIEPDQP